MPNVRTKLIQIIQSKGSVTVAEFMEYCLGDLDHGYYRTRNPIGRTGDFTTSPEISQMFGEIIGLWGIDLCEQFEESDEIALIELGPGRGTLMGDVLRAMAMRPNILGKISVHLLEINPYLIDLQKESLKNYPVTWHETLEGMLQDCESKLTFVIANEFFDVLPVQQFVYQEEWFERLITYDPQKDQFCFCLAQQSTRFKEQLEHYPTPKAGDVFEISIQTTHMYQQLMRFFSRHKGGMLIFDYGYTQPLYGDSLQAVKEHRFCDTLSAPGECDLTAHVNFWQLYQHNFQDSIEAYVRTQGEFLVDHGIRVRAAQLAHGKPESVQKQIYMDLERLTSTQEMGQLFKVLEIYAR